MIAIDTNVLVRLAVEDDPLQAKAVTSLFADQRIFVAKTVLLETDWVLRSRYGLSATAISAFFSFLDQHPQVLFEQEAQVHEAFSLARRGMEFADALHLVSSAGLPFRTFDRSLQKLATRHGYSTAVITGSAH